MRATKIMKLLTNPKIGVIVVEHRDRLTRFGFNYIAKLLEARGGRIEVIFPDVGLSPTITTNETKDELVDDFVAVITSMSARIYGRRNAKKKLRKSNNAYCHLRLKTRLLRS
jgi:predicted site-specific integrase-resolvase